MNKQETLNWKTKTLTYLLIIIALSFAVSLISCTKEDQEPETKCKRCNTIVRYEPDSGGEYRDETKVDTNCVNPANSATTEYGTFEFKLWWLEKDSSITITGNKITAIRCNQM